MQRAGHCTNVAQPALHDTAKHHTRSRCTATKRTRPHDFSSLDLIEVLLKIWPVPVDHKGLVVDPQAKAQDWVRLKHLMDAGMLAAGDELLATHRDFSGVEATVTADGGIELNGKLFGTPSGAGDYLRKKPTNGWYFWSLADGRRLRDVRAEFLSRP